MARRREINRENNGQKRKPNRSRRMNKLNLGPILAGALAIVCTGSALAESKDYRNGYLRGYSDARAGRPNAYGNTSGNGRIVIHVARYGTNSISCNAQPRMQKLANKRRTTDGVHTLDVTNDTSWCGDPAKGKTKILAVSYSCGDGPVKNVVAKKGRTVTLVCVVDDDD
jgi:hypothetical protein